jgi:hypothetical protein
MKADKQRRTAEAPPQRSKTSIARGEAKVPGRYIDLVGPVSESRIEHMRRHKSSNAVCPRCRWYQFDTQWKALDNWIMERPSGMGGVWSLGCRVCHVAMLKTTQTLGRHRCAVTKWCNFTYHSLSIQASQFANHRGTEIHKRSLQAALSPSASAGSQTLQATVEDEKLLMGGVPQPVDWLKAWSATRTMASWETVVQMDHVYAFANNSRCSGTGQRAFKLMVEILREIIRRRKRAWLAHATCISLGFDDRGAYQWISFRCDAAGPHIAEADLGSRSGVIGIINVLKGTTEDQFDDDYACRKAAKIKHVVQRFFTPLGSATLDEVAFVRFCQHVTAVAVDKQLMKTANVLRLGLFPKMIICQCDPSHAIRIAVRDPLQRADRFAEIFQMLFEDSHALLKDQHLAFSRPQRYPN